MADQSLLKKYDKLGIDYTLWNVEPPSTEVVERVCVEFRTVGLKNH